MSETALGNEIRAAVYELQRYLGDELAPMMVTDSVLILMDHPPAILAPQIHAWVGSQYSRAGSSYSTSDYLYHAVKKLHVLCELDLIDAERLREYLKQLGETLLEDCPEEERERLRQQFGRLGESAAVMTSGQVDKIYQVAGGPSAGTASAPAARKDSAPAGDREMSRALRRFSILLERLGGSASAGLRGQAAPEIEQLQTQAVVTAAVQARNETELQDLLRQLGAAGLDSRTEQIFRMLSRSLPEWNVPLGPSEATGAAGPVQNKAMEAMRKMVALAESPEEWARRFNDLVLAAIDQFNTGSIARAATILDLAERMLIGKERHQDVVNAIRRRAHEAIKEEPLRAHAERLEERSALLRFMNFFPAMTPEGLLRQLHDEKTRERRWLLLLLLERHGASARTAAVQELEAFLRGDRNEPHGFHQRNLIHLLRRIPAGEVGPGEKELEALSRLSKLDQPAIVVREAIRTLGPLAHPAAERVLLTRLREIEAAALRHSPAADGKPSPLLELLDASCSALALQRTSGSLGAVVQHGLREEPSLGEARARLDVLGAQDLSPWPDLVERMLRAARERMPRKILGLVVQKQESLPHLIRALAGTPLPAVRTMLEEIVAKYSNQEIAAEAARALEALKSAGPRAEPPPPGLTGDVGLFGLPNLFQSLSDSRVTGVLTLRDERGRICGTICFTAGRIGTAEYTHIKGEDALYQMFEKPEARTFAFQAQSAPSADEAAGDLTEVIPMLMEAMRRQDEFQQARVLVPDGAQLRLSGTKPTKLEEEEDLKLTQLVWSKVVAGASPEECEEKVPVDAFRVRRLLAHWVESGTLQIAAAAAGPVEAQPVGA